MYRNSGFCSFNLAWLCRSISSFRFVQEEFVTSYGIFSTYLDIFSGDKARSSKPSLIEVKCTIPIEDAHANCLVLPRDVTNDMNNAEMISISRCRHASLGPFGIGDSTLIPIRISDPASANRLYLIGWKYTSNAMHTWRYHLLVK